MISEVISKIQRKNKAEKQKLVDMCFNLVISCTEEKNYKFFKKMSMEEKAEWTAKHLRTCGFDTTPMGASWGVLK